jgi:hypothetical protein
MRRAAAHLGVAGPQRPDLCGGPAGGCSSAVGRRRIWFAWDEARGQYDQPALAAAIRRGRLVRLLAGGSVTRARLTEVLREMDGRLAIDLGFALLLIPGLFTVGATAAIVGTPARRRSGASAASSAGETD